jgi:hypothetical protein
MYRQLGELLGYIVWERVILELGAIAVQTKKKLNLYRLLPELESSPLYYLSQA